jgi:hypothetical protein
MPGRFSCGLCLVAHGEPFSSFTFTFGTDAIYPSESGAGRGCAGYERPFGIPLDRAFRFDGRGEEGMAGHGYSLGLFWEEKERR